MRELNCLGDFCPVPMMKLTRLLSQGPKEDVKLITDHSCVCESITEFCRKKKFSLSITEPVSGVWEMYIGVAPEGENSRGPSRK